MVRAPRLRGVGIAAVVSTISFGPNAYGGSSSNQHEMAPVNCKEENSLRESDCAIHSVRRLLPADYVGICPDQTKSIYDNHIKICPSFRFCMFSRRVRTVLGSTHPHIIGVNENMPTNASMALYVSFTPIFFILSIILRMYICSSRRSMCCNHAGDN